MRIHWVIAALSVAACNGVTGAGPAATGDSRVVAYAKQIDVANMDSTLKSQSLARWLSSSELHLTNIQWRESDCDLMPDDTTPKSKYPLCVTINFRRPNSWGRVYIEVGTIQRGVEGRPRLFGCSVKSNAPPPRGQFHSVNKLSELPAMLDAADAEARSQQ